jgi:hypothetical protein
MSIFTKFEPGKVEKFNSRSRNKNSRFRCKVTFNTDRGRYLIRFWILAFSRLTYSLSFSRLWRLIWGGSNRKFFHLRLPQVYSKRFGLPRVLANISFFSDPYLEFIKVYAQPVKCSLKNRWTLLPTGRPYTTQWDIPLAFREEGSVYVQKTKKKKCEKE